MLALCYLNLFFSNYQNIDVTIDISKETQNDGIVVLSGTIYNGSAKNVFFVKFNYLNICIEAIIIGI